MFTENTFTKCIDNKLAKENSISRNTSKAEQGAHKNTAIYEDIAVCRIVQNFEKNVKILKRVYMCGGGKGGWEVMVKDKARNAGLSNKVKINILYKEC